MDERRQALGMTWAEVASKADVTVETLRAIRRGKNEPSGLTKRGLERALGWEPGSIQAVLSDGTPRPVDSALPSPSTEAPGSVNATPPGDEPESPITAQLQALLAQAQQRTEDKLAELSRKFDEEREALSRKVDEQRELIQRLLDERKGA